MTLFVAGVHAVGKTYLLKPVCEQLGLMHATASQLIREQKGQANWTATRQVDDVDENQKALVAAVQTLNAEGQQLVLDGHFVLRKSAGVHGPIGLPTFSQLQIKSVVLLEAPSEVVLSRLTQRGDPTWTLTEVEAFAHLEAAHAISICEQLSIPMTRLNMPTEEQARQALLNAAQFQSGTNLAQDH